MPVYRSSSPRRFEKSTDDHDHDYEHEHEHEHEGTVLLLTSRGWRLSYRP
jgi:hypothetical protein